MKPSYAEKSSMEIPTQLRKGPHEEEEANRLYIRLDLYSRGKTSHTLSEEKEHYSACMLRKPDKLFFVYDLFY